jgi:Sec-independent protein translocase protein TatA
VGKDIRVDKKTRLKRLEDLFQNIEVSERFTSREACLEWSSKVAPLLKYNALIHEEFTRNASFLAHDLSSILLEPTIDKMIYQVRMAIEELKIEVEDDQDDKQIDNKRDEYVDEERLKALKSIPKDAFDLTKLIRMLEELNICSQADCYMATIMLVRAVIDHVPPIFGCGKFAEVANNIKSHQKSFKESMGHLEESSRKIADQHLHYQVRKKEELPNRTQVNFRNDLDVLLAEIVRILK